jgi:hypothetical protein
MACAGTGAQVPNDTCAGYTWVYDGINPGAPNGASASFFSNAGAALASEVATPCLASPDYRDVWFRWITFTSGWATFETCTPSGFAPGTASTALAVYSNCLGALVGCGSPSASCPNGSRLTLPVISGGSYLIRVSSPGTAPAGGTFYLTVSPPAPPPPNDDQANAIPVSVGSNPASGSYTINGATLDGTGLCATLSDVDVWFTHTPATSGITTLTTGGFALRVTDPSGVPLVCNMTGSSGLISVIAGVQYQIRVSAPAGCR